MRLGFLATLAVSSLLLAGCAAHSDPDDRAAYERDLAVEALDGVVLANGGQVLLDITETPEQIAEAAERVRAHMQSLYPERPLSLLLFNPDISRSETVFEVSSVVQAQEHFAERVELWAGLISSGFASVEMHLFAEGSEYGEGVITVEDWVGEGEEPTAGDTYRAILDDLPAAGLTPGSMKVNVLLDITILGGETARRVPAELFDTVQRIVDHLNPSSATISIGPDRTAVTIGRHNDGFGNWMPYSDPDRAWILAECDAAGLLNDELSISEVFGEPGPMIWSAAP